MRSAPRPVSVSASDPSRRCRPHVDSRALHPGLPVLIFTQTTARGVDPPGRFSLRFYEPPPPEAMPAGMLKKDSKTAVARILAFRDGAPWSAEGYYEQADWFLGGAGDFLVWYVEEEMPPSPDFLTEDGARAGLSKGYNLVRLAKWTEEESAARKECFDSAERDALARVNDTHGTAYTSSVDMPDDVSDEYYEHYNALEVECGVKVKMTVVPSGTDHPVSLSFDLNNGESWIDWY